MRQASSPAHTCRPRHILPFLAVVLGGCALAAPPRLACAHPRPGPPFAECLRTRTVHIGGHPWYLRVASTPAAAARGLMGVRDLPPDTGMLFVFATPQPVSFWMAHMRMPLDMAFVGTSGRFTGFATRQPPCRPLTCPSVQSPGAAMAVIEVPSGTVAAKGWFVGEAVQGVVF